MRKNIVAAVLLILLPGFVQAGSVQTRVCSKNKKNLTFVEKVKVLFGSAEIVEKVELAKRLRTGSSKHSAKNRLPSSKIYFSISQAKFISSLEKESDFIDLIYFLDGTLSLAACNGAVIQSVKSGNFD